MQSLSILHIFDRSIYTPLNTKINGGNSIFENVPKILKHDNSDCHPMLTTFLFASLYRVAPHASSMTNAKTTMTPRRRTTTTTR